MTDKELDNIESSAIDHIEALYYQGSIRRMIHIRNVLLDNIDTMVGLLLPRDPEETKRCASYAAFVGGSSKKSTAKE